MEKNKNNYPEKNLGDLKNGTEVDFSETLKEAVEYVNLFTEDDLNKYISDKVDISKFGEFGEDGFVFNEEGKECKEGEQEMDINIYCIVDGKKIYEYEEGKAASGIYFQRGKAPNEMDYVYIGQYEGGEMNGKGILNFSDKCKYFGEFHKGVYNGEGTYIWPNGNELFSDNWEWNPDPELGKSVGPTSGEITLKGGKKYKVERSDNVSNWKIIGEIKGEEIKECPLSGKFLNYLTGDLVSD